ncbi:DUF4129 domain-containing protein [Granulicella sp. 5B5]|uniref:DUF4129 domain-containing protein n=1 Tax=Granulicella sp. 5B5 TaxID=1617967 RepID=UPI0015F393B2|nr:DUF4129 domain-containing protein [Granulicella sp. 5B5]QMV19310.1 DUF4129 domain-containing protein [Granulicella sp. 5B5]
MAASKPLRNTLRLLLLTTLLSAAASPRAHALDTPQPTPLTTNSTDPATLANEAANFKHARQAADDVLHKAQFRHDMASSWWDQKKLALTRTIGRIFSRVNRIGKAAPWLAHLLEWLLFGAAALTLLLFLLREFRRQRLQVSLTSIAIKAEAFSREADDWSQRAAAFAQQAQWRDAVHCLYWAAIVLLESRRAWRHNPTRTPREYVRLLRPGSPQQVGLRSLTQVFERTWYGLRDTTTDEYTQARALYDGLVTASSIGASLKAERLDATPTPAEGL